MKESFEINMTFKNVSPSEIYDAWLDSEKHSEMTGGEAICSSEVGEIFTTWDGYISGKNLALTPNQEIIQSWRTTEFEDDDEDSKIVVSLKKIANDTELKLIHTHIPKGETQYKQGWEDFYFIPMKNYFEATR